MSSDAARLMELLGLEEDELCRVLAVDPLSLVSGRIEHRPELPLRLDLLSEAEERTGGATLRRWVRSGGASGRPLDMLLARDFGAFERALEDLSARGFVLRAAAPPPREPGAPASG